MTSNKAARFIIRQEPAFSPMPDPSDEGSGNARGSMTKTVLVYVFIVVVVFIITCMILRKYRFLRLQRQNQVYSNFNSGAPHGYHAYHGAPQPPNHLNSDYPLPPPTARTHDNYQAGNTDRYEGLPAYKENDDAACKKNDGEPPEYTQSPENVNGSNIGRPIAVPPPAAFSE